MSISRTSRDCNKLRLRIDAFSERVIGDQDFTLRTLVIVCLGVTLSYLSAKVGLALVVPPHNISLFWFTNALLFRNEMRKFFDMAFSLVRLIH